MAGIVTQGIPHWGDEVELQCCKTVFNNFLNFGLVQKKSFLPGQTGRKRVGWRELDIFRYVEKFFSVTGCLLAPENHAQAPNVGIFALQGFRCPLLEQRCISGRYQFNLSLNFRGWHGCPRVCSPAPGSRRPVWPPRGRDRCGNYCWARDASFSESTSFPSWGVNCSSMDSACERQGIQRYSEKTWDWIGSEIFGRS